MKHLQVGDWRFYYLEKNGRLSQTQFWYGYLPILGLSMLCSILSPYLFAEIPVAVLILTALPTVMLLIKRAHDIGLSGHYCWLLLVPIINVFVFLTLAFLWGDYGDNRFGADPKVDDHPFMIWT